jgi:signal transduction histidine kinase
MNNLENKFQQYRFAQMVPFWTGDHFRNWFAVGIFGLIVANIFDKSKMHFIVNYTLNTGVLFWLANKESRPNMRMANSIWVTSVGLLPLLNLVFNRAEFQDPTEFFAGVMAPLLGAMFARLPAKVVFITRLPHIVVLSWRWLQKIPKGDGLCGVWTVWAILILIVFFTESVERRVYLSQQATANTILGSVSHELQTPIYTVQSIISDVLHSIPITENKHDSNLVRTKLEDILNGCNMLKELVDNILLVEVDTPITLSKGE